MNTNVAPLSPVTAANYYERLGSSLEEKLFFVDRIPKDVTVFADFGCGDGRLLRAVGAQRFTHRLIGYDINHEALPHDPGEVYTSNLAAFAYEIEKQRAGGRKVCLILSSVVHEVLSQGTSWFKFWRDIQALKCDYVSIRDMACSLDAQHSPPTNPLFARQLEKDARFSQVLLYGVSEPGLFSTQAEVLEALLKYRYVDNQQRELEESYFALAAEQWLNLCMVGSGYQVTHYDHHSVQWHREQWLSEWGYDVSDPTHIKMILRRI